MYLMLRDRGNQGELESVKLDQWTSSLIGCAPFTRMSGLELEAQFLNSTLTRSPGSRAEQLPLSAGLKSVGFMSLPTGNTFLLPLTVKAEFWVRLEHPFLQ